MVRYSLRLGLGFDCCIVVFTLLSVLLDCDEYYVRGWGRTCVPALSLLKRERDV